MKIKFKSENIFNCCQELLEIDSPSGDTAELSDFLESQLTALGFRTGRTHKDVVYAEFQTEDRPIERIVTAHIDTLGAMVSEIMPNGRLRFVMIGGFAYNSLEGENVRIKTADGRIYTGSVMPDKISIHIFDNYVSEFKREYSTMSVRLDELVETAEDTRSLGIEVGDFIAFEPRTEITASAFIKSRFLDNKICAALMIEVMKELESRGEKPVRPTRFVFSNFEEVGHGVTAVPDSVKELIALDIGTVGGERNSRETAVTIVARDSRTPYPFPLRRRLQEIAIRDDIEYRIDTHIRYGSDGSIAATAGMNFNFSCFGPGVEATHHYERTHERAVLATAELLHGYLMTE
ncbi:MAG: M42 family metallopeptidase [Eubacteriales bacterium]|nr:M42 family metallopeptidase [Eubacteriales bacterium]